MYEEPESQKIPFWKTFPIEIRAVLLGLGLLTAVAVPFPYQGIIEGKQWTRTETAMEFRVTTDTDWQDNLHLTPHRDPDEDGQGDVAGTESIRDCVQEVRSHRRVRTGSHTVCSGVDPFGMGAAVPWTRAGGGGGFSHGGGSHPSSHPSSHPISHPSGGSGSHPTPHVPTCHTVTDYTSVPVYDLRCSFDTWKWTETATLEKTGTEDPPAWPGLPRPPHGRIQRKEVYQIRVGGRLFEVEEGPFSTLETGEEVKVWRDVAFGVLALRGAL